MRHYLLFRARDKARLLHSEGMERPKKKTGARSIVRVLSEFLSLTNRGSLTSYLLIFHHQPQDDELGLLSGS